MKNSIKSTFCKFGLLLLLMMLGITGKAQTVAGGQYSISIASATATANSIDVDLVVSVVNPSAGMRFTGFQTSINFNTAIINGGTISASRVTGTEAVNFTSYGSIGTATAGTVRIALTKISDGSSGLDLTQGQMIHVGTYRISNTANWGTGNAALWLQDVLFTGKTQSLVQGVAFGTSGAATSYTTLQPASPAGLIIGYNVGTPLALQVGQVCATSGLASVTNPSCSGGTGSAAVTLSPTPVPALSSVSYTVDGGSIQTASLSGASFTVPGLSNGTHSIVVSVPGCSPVTVSATVNVPAQLTNSTPITACDNYTWSVTGTNYTSSGTYTGTTTNGNGCTVNETLNLTINHSTSSSESQTACGTYTWPVNGATYTESGTYTSVTTNAAGCPDTKTLVLTINPSANNTTPVTACNSYTWSANGQTYTASGTFSVTTGCNTEFLVLTITNSTSHTTTASACGTYTWEAPLGNGQTYTTSQSGLTHTSTNEAGCTHTETLNLTIRNESITAQPVAPFICNATGSTTSTSVSTNAAGASFQWQRRIVTTTAPDPVWLDMSESANYTGVNTSTLGITRTATAFAAGTQFRVLVTGECGVLTSNTVALTVILTVKAGSITSPTSVCLGGNITFTLTKYAGTSIQWQSALTNSTAAPGDFQNIDGATSDVLTLTGATTGMNKAYRAVVTSNCGTTTTATTPVKLIKVNPLTVPGTITGGGTVCVEGSGTLKLA
ncbi:MAG: hypothetical protein ABIW86_05535, partial [Flavobacterium sp.]